MNKKIVALMLIVTVAAASAFAAPLIQIGPSLSYNKQVWDEENNSVMIPEGFSEIEVDDFGIGGDVRINLGMLQVAAFADFGMPFGKDINAITMNGGVSLNSVISLAFLDVFAGVGAHVDVVHDLDAKTWTFNGSEFSDFGSLLTSSSLFYRGGATINIGLFGVSIFADIPTESGAIADGVSLAPDLERTKISASILFNIG